jgi:hypothetical protein
MDKVHRDQVGDPDQRGWIKVGVREWFGPDPVIPGYVPWRVDLEHVRDPCRLVTYVPAANGMDWHQRFRDGREGLSSTRKRPVGADR